jgi:hypothetical protein
MASPVRTALVGAVLLAACDVSQKLPQTAPSSTPDVATSSAVGAVPVARDVRQPAEMPPGFSGAAAAGGKSIRLHGPGVSRKRQTHI